MKQGLLHKLTVISLIFVSFFTLNTELHAQEIKIYSAEDIFIEISPQIPGPNERVTLNLKSYSFNLNNYYITWFENGTRKDAQFGLKSFNFTTGESGESTDITATIEVGTQLIRKELSFTPAEVDLLWEALDAYTPPFYEGKGLPLSQAKLRVTALPSTRIIQANDAPSLVYYWEDSYKAVNNASGFGKQSYTFSADPLNTEEKISVTANDRNENSFAKNTLVLPMEEFEAKILFYEVNEAGRILSQRALNAFPRIDGDSVRISFHPLNMSTTAANFVDLYVDWFINDTSTAPQNFARQNELNLSSNGASGSASIGVELEGIENILQKVKTNINLIFSN